MGGNTYNQAMSCTHSDSFRRWMQTCLASLPGLPAAGQLSALARSMHRRRRPSRQAAGKNRILLVLPFDNRTGQPNLEWIREAAPEILNARFASAGFAPMSRADRMYALDHLGLPQRFQPSRASALKLAQTLDADSIVVGSYRDGRHRHRGRGARAGCAAPAHERRR